MVCFYLFYQHPWFWLIAFKDWSRSVWQFWKMRHYNEITKLLFCARVKQCERERVICMIARFGDTSWRLCISFCGRKIFNMVMSGFSYDSTEWLMSTCAFLFPSMNVENYADFSIHGKKKEWALLKSLNLFFSIIKKIFKLF